MTDVIILGSINMDVVAYCRAHPHPGETIMGQSVAFFPGGKGANQATAVARAGGRALMHGCVGQDAFGGTLREHLNTCGVDISAVRTVDSAASGTALITVSENGENSIIVISGANAESHAPSIVPHNCVAVTQFETPHSESIKLFRIVKAAGGTTILNPSPFADIPAELLTATDTLVLNEHEYASLTKSPAIASASELLATTTKPPVPCCLVTLGKDGVVILRQDAVPVHIAGYNVTAVDTTGAGDCFTGYFAAAIAGGESVESAARRATAAAAISVTKKGAGSSMPARADVDLFLTERAAA